MRRPPRRVRSGASPARLSLRLLGGFEARRPTGQPVLLPKRKSQALLAYLAAGPGDSHPRDTLTALLWSEAAREQARNSLRQTLFVLRRALAPAGADLLRADGDTVVIDRARLDVDVEAFERLARSESLEPLERAAALYGGDLLAGIRIDEPGFEDWLLPRREHLRAQALGVLQRLLAHRLKRGQAGPALEAAARLLALDPLQESVQRTVMELHAGQGNIGSALRQYETYRAALGRELGREPGPEVRDLYHAIRRRQVAAAPLARPEMPLIGRTADWEALRRSLEAAWNRRPQVVTVLGEAGIGKSRLVEELIVEARARRGHAATGRCYATQQILPFGPWLDAVRTGGLLATDIVAGLSPGWRAELARLFPELAEGSEQPAAPPSHPRLFEAFAHLLEQAAATRPLLLVLEDAHWADELSLRLLGFLARRMATARLLLVVTVRDEEADDTPVLGQVLAELDRERRLARRRLAPLDRADIARLVRALAEAGAPPTGLVDEIWSASAGNPFVAVETLRARAEGGGRLPERVRLRVGWRLDRLTARGRHLATVAAVIGRETSLSLLALAAGLGEADAEDEVADLVRRRLVSERPAGVDFGHARVRDVLLAGLTGARARLLHRRVAESLEAHHARRLDEHLAEIGAHHLAGEAWEPAVRYYRRAGERAFAQGAYREAAACFTYALEALRALPEDRATLEQGVDLLLTLRHALLPLGEAARIRESLEQASELAARLDDRRRQAHVLAYQGSYHWYVGEHARAQALATQALEWGTGLGDRALLASATYLIAVSQEAQGGYREAARLLGPLATSLGGGLTSANYGTAAASAIFASSYLAHSLSELGEFTAARAAAEESVRIMEPLHHPFLAVHATCAQAAVALRQGRPQDVIERLERLREVNRAGSALVVFPVNEWFLAYAWALVGYAEAPGLLRRMERLTDEVGFSFYYPFWLTLLAEGYLLVGEPAEALARAERALALAQDRGERGVEARSRWLVGDALTALDSPDIARIGDAYRTALARADDLGMAPLQAHCRRSLGRLAARQGRPDEAASHHEAARRLYEALGMTRWLQEVRAPGD